MMRKSLGVRIVGVIQTWRITYISVRHLNTTRMKRKLNLKTKTTPVGAVAGMGGIIIMIVIMSSQIGCNVPGEKLNPTFSFYEMYPQNDKTHPIF